MVAREIEARKTRLGEWDELREEGVSSSYHDFVYYFLRSQVADNGSYLPVIDYNFT